MSMFNLIYSILNIPFLFVMSADSIIQAGVLFSNFVIEHNLPFIGALISQNYVRYNTTMIAVLYANLEMIRDN